MRGHDAKCSVHLLGGCTNQEACTLEKPTTLCHTSQLLLQHLGRPLSLLHVGLLSSHKSSVLAALRCVNSVNAVHACMGCAARNHVQCDGGATARSANLGLVRPPPICSWSSTCMLSTAQSP